MADPKDIVPYLPLLMPYLKDSLVDPIPEVRAVAARALGALVRGLGEEEFGGLSHWLVELMRAEASSVERSGGAQALAEVLGALGEPRLSEVLRELLPLADHPKPATRQGLLWLLAFLPGVLAAKFSGYITTLLPVVLGGLADDAEMVREVAMRAGEVVVSRYARSHVSILLPALQEGMFDDNWRIRQSSVNLLGHLLYAIAGTTAVGVMDNEDDDAGLGDARGDAAILEALGEARRNDLLASLYVMRSDVSAVVRQSSLQVWKSVVSHTPRTLKSILPLLMDRIIDSLASTNADKRGVAGRCLGDIVRFWRADVA